MVSCQPFIFGGMVCVFLFIGFFRQEKAHKHKRFDPVALGTTPGLSLGQAQFVPGTHPGCPRVFSLFYTVEAQFVLGTNPVCPRDKPVANGGRKNLCAKCLCAFSGPIFCSGPNNIPVSNTRNFIYIYIYICVNGRGRFGGQTAGGHPKSLSSAQAASLCSAGIERARKCLQAWHFLRCCHSTHGLVFRGSRS